MTDNDLPATPLPDQVFIDLLMFTHGYKPHNQTIAGDHHNILFLSEGFTVEEKSVFDLITCEAAKQFLKISPFNFHLDGENSIRNKFMFYSAFLPSPASGISVEPKVNCEIYNYATPVCPSEDAIYKLNYKNSAMGLIYDLHNGRIIIRSKRNDENLIRRIIERIYWDVGSSNPYVDPDIPECWQKGGRDFGLVCILVNDDLDCGISYTTEGYVICSIRNSNYFKLTLDKTDHFPRSDTPLDMAIIGSVIAHEFGHSYFELGDEYVDTQRYPPNPKQARKYKNLLLREDVPWFLENFPGLDGKWLPTLTSPEVSKYISTNNKPLSETKDEKNGAMLQFPDREFWAQNPGLSSNSPWEIIGLYEGAYYSFHNIYRPAGVCRMRNRKSSSAVHVESLPAIIDWEAFTYIMYDSQYQLLVCYGKMFESHKERLLDLARLDYEDFRKAVEKLYQLSNSERVNIVSHQSFCYVCKYYIIDKLEQDQEKRSRLIERLNTEYPAFIRENPTKIKKSD